MMSQCLWARRHIIQIQRYELLRRTFDAIHRASATPVNIAASVLAKKRSFGRAVEIYTASVEPHTDDPYYREFRWSVLNCDKLIAVSDSVAEKIAHYFQREVDAIIPNGVDLDYFDPRIAGLDEPAFKHIKPYVLFVGALLPRKRPEFVLELAEQMPDVEFVMVGRESKHLGGAAIVAKIRTIPNVHFLGVLPKTDVRNLMHHASLLLFPSDLEGMANVLLEASAMGLPILAQPVSSMPEVVKEGVNGWLIDGNSTKDWHNMTRTIIHWTEDERGMHRERARAWISERFSWDLISGKVREFYLSNVP